jgi:hypothetical protein
VSHSTLALSAPKQLDCVHFQGGTNPQERINSWNAQASLDVTDHLAGQRGHFCDPRQRQPPASPLAL